MNNEKAINLILKCAEKADGLLSRVTIVKFLQGQTSRAIMKKGLDHFGEFGALADMSKADILSNIDYLIERGCLSVGFLFFPNLYITDPGRNRLARMPKLEPKEAPLQAVIDTLPEHLVNMIKDKIRDRRSELQNMKYEEYMKTAEWGFLHKPSKRYISRIIKSEHIIWQNR